MIRLPFGAVIAAIVILPMLLGCSPKPSPSTSPLTGDCVQLDGEEVNAISWAPGSDRLVIESQDVGGRLDARSAHIRYMDVQERSFTHVVTTQSIVGGTAIGPDGEVFWMLKDLGGRDVATVQRSEDGNVTDLFTVEHGVALDWTDAGIVYATLTIDSQLVAHRVDDERGDQVLFETDRGKMSFWVSRSDDYFVLGDSAQEQDEDHYVVMHDRAEQSLAPTERFSLLKGMTVDRTAVVIALVDQETLEFDGLYRLPLDGSQAVEVAAPQAIGAMDISDDGMIAYSGFRDPASSRICFAPAAAWGL
jgi:hypothetical protein